MDESGQSNFKSSEHEQSWQIPRKQGAIFIKGTASIRKRIYGKIM